MHASQVVTLKSSEVKRNYLVFNTDVMGNTLVMKHQGHPTTVFCKYLFREGKIAENFLWLEEGKKFLDGHSIHVKFSKLPLYSIPTIFESLIFSYFTPRVKLLFFFLRKRNLNFSDSEMRWGEESKKSSLS